MKKFQFLICALLLTGFAAASRVEASYGAIAYSVATGSTGWSRGFYTQSEAEYEALRRCYASDCKPVVWFNGACGALAVSRYNPSLYGWAWNTEVAFAENQALRFCQIHGGLDCKTVAWACSP